MVMKITITLWYLKIISHNEAPAHAYISFTIPATVNLTKIFW
jgi:hypothetical protein